MGTGLGNKHAWCLGKERLLVQASPGLEQGGEEQVQGGEEQGHGE